MYPMPVGCLFKRRRNILNQSIERRYEKAAEIVRRADDSGRIVILEEIRRIGMIGKVTSSHATLMPMGHFCIIIHSFRQRITAE